MDCNPPGSSVHGDSPGKNARVGCHALLQGIFLTQGLNPGLLHHLNWQADSLPLGSVAQLSPTLCNPMDCSTPGFLVLHQLPELTQTHVHRVGDAIQSSHPLSSHSHPAFNLSQHQGLFQGVSSLHQVAKYWSFSFSICPSSNIQDWFPLGLIDWSDLPAVPGTLRSLDHLATLLYFQQSSFGRLQLKA